MQEYSVIPYITEADSGGFSCILMASPWGVKTLLWLDILLKLKEIQISIIAVNFFSKHKIKSLIVNNW